MYKNNSNHQPSQQEVINLDININILTGSEVLVYNHLLGMGNITNRIFLSQTYLAYKLGLCRATVNRALRRLAELNLIQKIDRGWKEERTRIKKTCYYLISKLFDLPEIRKRYQGKFKSLIYLKLITNFDQIIESGYKHYVEIVTGIKSSLSFLFKNKEVDNLGYRGNRIRRRRQGIREGLKQEVSNLTIEEGSKMSEFIQNLGGFNEAAKVYLSAYRDDVVKESIKGLGNYKPTGDAWSYFVKILSRVTRTKNLEPDYHIINSVVGIPKLVLPITSPSIIASSPNPGFKKQQEEKKPYIPRTQWQSPELNKPKETAMQVANNLAKAAEALRSGNEFARFSVKGLCEIEYQTTGEEGEDLAIQYITSKKKEFESQPSFVEKIKELDLGKPTGFREILSRTQPTKQTTETNIYTVAALPVTSQFESESTTLNEMDYDEVLD